MGSKGGGETDAARLPPPREAGVVSHYKNNHRQLLPTLQLRDGSQRCGSQDVCQDLHLPLGVTEDVLDRYVASEADLQTFGTALQSLHTLCAYLEAAGCESHERLDTRWTTFTTLSSNENNERHFRAYWPLS